VSRAPGSERPTGQWITDPDGLRWFLDTGAVSLDLAYTGALGDPEPREALPDAAALGTWLSAHLAPVSEPAERDLADARTLRQAIGDIAAALADGREPAPRDVDVLNLYAATPDLPPALGGGSRQAGRALARPAQALASAARDAVAVFGAGSERIHRCSADDCTVLYLDTTRSGTRRWCSMRRCGNRAKVRAHRARQLRERRTGIPARVAPLRPASAAGAPADGPGDDDGPGA
jgi:predicted RNA-binding Zn ribbon-like protein